MILDTFYNKYSKKYTISYIDEDTGNKKIFEYTNVLSFPSYRENLDLKLTPGCLRNWNGNPVELVMEKEGDSRFNQRNYWFYQIPDHHLSQLLQTKTPRLYSFDIEVEVDDKEFPEPSIAKFPILTISIVTPELNTIVLGTRKLEEGTGNGKEEEMVDSIKTKINDYISQSEYYKKTLMSDFPTGSLGFEYKYFETEEEMLKWFLKWVSGVPIIAGWNSILFDWQYIQNRITNHYPDVKLSTSSCVYSLDQKRYQDMRGDYVYLKIPAHTLVLDMMDVVGNYDLAVMPQKENLSLDYIASESPVKLGKIKYDGNLQDLYESDYPKYVFYNAVDSILVQLIDKCFRTLNNIYSQAHYATCPIKDAFSKIALTESMFWNYFNNIGPGGSIKEGIDRNTFKSHKYNNVKIATLSKEHKRVDTNEDKLIGAYVKKPVPGIWDWVACCDFASLYPSTIITCNLSIENFIGKLKPGTFNISKNLSNGKGSGSLVDPINENNKTNYNYSYSKWRNDNEEWMRTGCRFHVRGTLVHDSILEIINLFKNEIFENESVIFHSIEEYSNKVSSVFTKHKYFISVNGCIYKNDKDYAFKIIEKELKINRGKGKYLKQHLDAQVLVDTFTGEFKEDVIKEINKFIVEIYKGNIPDSIQSQLHTLTNNDTLLQLLTKHQLEDRFMTKLINAVVHYTSFEQACKLLGNSMYGGSSHTAFFWFNMNIANDITGEARNLIHLMEDFVPRAIKENPEEVRKAYLKAGVEISDKSMDLYHIDTEDVIKSGDTDSLYLSHNQVVNAFPEGKDLTYDQKTQITVSLHKDFLDGANNEFMTNYYKSRGVDSIHEFELETIASRGFWLNVKKRYSQSIAWKDGKFFKQEEQPIKTKGLELIKASYPTLARKLLKDYVTEILQPSDPNNTNLKDLHIHLFNITNKYREKWCSKGNTIEDIDEICPSSSVNGYFNYVLNDDPGKKGEGTKANLPEFAPKTPAHVRGLAMYNWFRQIYLNTGQYTIQEAGSPVYGGKCRVYLSKGTSKLPKHTPFTFVPKSCPQWALDKDSPVPIDKLKMFEKCVIDPINRILKPIGMDMLSAYENQGVQLSLF